jgi:3-deoxy-D-manno-octulosonic-acid transferase
MIRGRKQWKIRLNRDFENMQDPVVWFHCASLGEFEQGRPLIESFKKTYPDYRILLTFYSPSGYEIRKDYPKAYAVHYLPWDTVANAKAFYSTVKPVAAFIIKYEFWYNLIRESKDRNIPVMVCSSIFRQPQIFFSPFGGLFRKLLRNLNHIFVQDTESKQLLKNIGITSVTISGDTRVDRVAALTKESPGNQILAQFANGSDLFIVGSSWPKDIEILADLINSEKQLKFVIAPHEIDETGLDQLESHIKRPIVRYTNFQESSQAEVLIVNTIGILSHLYKLGKYAYIGGAFGKGLHNILEPATFGLPLFFGNLNYRKFAEAVALVKLGGAFAAGSSEELYRHYRILEKDQERYLEAGRVSREYIEQHTGATEIIMKHVQEELRLK